MIEKVSSFLNEFKFEDIPKVAIDNSLRSFVDLIGVAASAYFFKFSWLSIFVYKLIQYPFTIFLLFKFLNL